jgi:hypothetical protein
VTWWLLGHRIRLVVGLVALQTVVLAAVAAGWVSVMIPTPFRIGAEPTPLVALVPLVVVGGLVTGLATDDIASPRTVARRDQGVLHVALVVSVIGAAIVAALISAGDAAIGAVAARNLIGLTGMALLVRPLVGSAASVGVVAAFLVAAMLFGPGPAGSAGWWAWPIHAPASGISGVLAGSCLLGGLMVTASRPVLPAGENRVLPSRRSSAGKAGVPPG